VCVEISGDADVGAAEQLRDLDELDAGGDQETRRRVPQIMEEPTRDLRGMSIRIRDVSAQLALALDLRLVIRRCGGAKYQRDFVRARGTRLS
jgi:hypothetical protein